MNIYQIVKYFNRIIENDFMISFPFKTLNERIDIVELDKFTNKLDKIIDIMFFSKYEFEFPYMINTVVEQLEAYIFSIDEEGFSLEDRRKFINLMKRRVNNLLRSKENPSSFDTGLNPVIDGVKKTEVYEMPKIDIELSEIEEKAKEGYIDLANAGLEAIIQVTDIEDLGSGKGFKFYWVYPDLTKMTNTYSPRFLKEMGERLKELGYTNTEPLADKFHLWSREGTTQVREGNISYYPRFLPVRVATKEEINQYSEV